MSGVTVPTMMALQRAFAGKERDVALVSISLNNDSPEDLQRFARDLGICGPIARPH